MASTPALGAYLRQIAKFPLLGDSEKEMFERLRKGDREARSRIIEANLRLVVKIANEFPRIDDHRREDMVFAGNIGLMEAVDKFDPSYGVKFCTFARKYILGRIRRQMVTAYGEGIINPGIANAVALKIKKYRDEVNATPTVGELCRNLGLKSGVVRALKDGWHFTSLNDKSCQTSREFVEICPDDGQKPVCQILEEEEMAEFLNAAIRDKLDARERHLVEKYYGLHGRERKNLRELSVERGMSMERIRQIIADAIQKIHREFLAMT